MKFSWCTIWMLGALLLIAAVDTLPDPPAVNPSATLCKILQLHVYSCDTVAQQSDSLNTDRPFPESPALDDAAEPYRPSDRIVLTGQAADPSPPSAQA